MQPVDTSGLLSQVGQAGPLFAFMMLSIIVLLWAIKSLYARNVALGEMFQKALVDSSLAMNNSALANNAIARQMEIMNAK